MYTILLLALVHLPVAQSSGVLDGHYIHEGSFATLEACEAERKALDARLPLVAVGAQPPALAWVTACVRR